MIRARSAPWLDNLITARVLSPLAWVLVVRLSLGIAYSLSVPIWEAYDEDGHFAYARYLAVHRTLLQPGDPEAQQVWENFQPPLYYVLIAPVIAPFDLGQTFVAPERNPYLAFGNAGINYALHPTHLAGTARATALAVYLARITGAFISTASVIAVYRAAGCVWPAEKRTAWTATCLYAFWPQYLFIGSMVTNDVLITALSAVAFYLALSLAKEGFRLLHALALGAALGLALMTKLNALALLPLAATALGLSVVRTHTWKSPRAWLVLAALGLLVGGAFWLLSSFEFVTAQVLQSGVVADFLRYANVSGRGPASLTFLLSALRYAFRTFIASFGWGNLETYGWLYSLWALGAGLALLGLSSAFIRRDPGTPPKLFALILLQTASLVGLTLALGISQQSVYLVPGRYLLPGLPAVTFLLIGGWRALLPGRLRPYLWKGLGLGIVLVSWSIPWMTLAPAYAKPPPLRSGAGIDYPLNDFFGEAIELMGYLRSKAVVPGQDYQIALCWQAVGPVAQNYAVVIEIVGPDGQGYSRIETYPGRGNYATSLWAVGQPFCDHYTFSVGRELPAPSAAQVKVSLQGPEGDRLPVKNLSGETVGQEVQIPVRVQGVGPVPALAHPVEYRFGNGIVLRGYDIQPLPDGRRGVQVVFRWEALADIQKNYTVFVHLRDTPLTYYALGDSPPRQGWYPTSLWQAGDVVLDAHPLTFPEAAATSPLDLYVGLYDPVANMRLPAFDAQGHPLPNGEVILARGLVLP